MKLALFSFVMILVPGLCFATPQELQKLKKADIPQSKSASCKTCHTSGKNLNAFGKEYKEAGKDFSKMKPAGEEKKSE